MKERENNLDIINYFVKKIRFKSSFLKKKRFLLKRFAWQGGAGECGFKSYAGRASLNFTGSDITRPAPAPPAPPAIPRVSAFRSHIRDLKPKF